MALRVFDQDGGRVKPHRLIVQHGAGEFRQVVALQVSAGVSDHRETGGVRFGEAVERERRDGANDILLCLAGDSIALHPGTQFDSIRHTFSGLESHGATSFRLR
jgi:hypothetical protein